MTPLTNEMVGDILTAQPRVCRLFNPPVEGEVWPEVFKSQDIEIAFCNGNEYWLVGNVARSHQYHIFPWAANNFLVPTGAKDSWGNPMLWSLLNQALKVYQESWTETTQELLIYKGELTKTPPEYGENHYR